MAGLTAGLAARRRVRGGRRDRHHRGARRIATPHRRRPGLHLRRSGRGPTVDARDARQPSWPCSRSPWRRRSTTLRSTWPTAPLETAPLATAADAALVVYTDRLADPGNMGTLVRAAAAFAAAALVASPGSVDLFSPKVVRAGMGAVFDLPLYQDVPLEQAVARAWRPHRLRPRRSRRHAARHPRGARRPDGRPGATGPAARGAALLVVGAERAGLSAEALAYVTDLVTIPLAGAGRSRGVESLNAGVAGAIAAVRALAPRRPGPTNPAGGAAPRKE